MSPLGDPQQEEEEQKAPVKPETKKAPQGDFAAGERASDADESYPDFARGERTSEEDETGTDFAAGERKQPKDPNARPDFARGQDSA